MMIIFELNYDMNRDDYLGRFRRIRRAPLNKIQDQAIILEKQSACFYSDAARLAKTLLAEASRFFLKLPNENEEN